MAVVRDAAGMNTRRAATWATRMQLLSANLHLAKLVVGFLVVPVIFLAVLVWVVF